ncbi:uncharacterized protein [Ptychodera flava]|uniref:uncharacterized protein n=1 Tax=Ptychodera flava TaxID=63121 RepID=UPI003969BBD6
MACRQTSSDDNTIGALQFSVFPSSYGLADQLSLLLDVKHPLGRDYRRFLEELGLKPVDINFLAERYHRPTHEALVTTLNLTSLKEIVDVLESIERNDCIRVTRKAILDQIKRKQKENPLDKVITRKEFNADIQTILSWDSTKLLRPQVPRRVSAIGRQSEISSLRIICLHLHFIREEFRQFLIVHIIRKPTDLGIKSMLLALTTTLARLILLFLFANDLILSINVVLPLWSSVHELSIIEHLTVLMLVLSDLVLAPMICALRDIVTEKHVRQVILEKMEKEKNKQNKKVSND